MMSQHAVPQWGSSNFGGMAARGSYVSRNSFGAVPASSATFSTGSDYAARANPTHGAVIATAQPSHGNALLQSGRMLSQGQTTPNPGAFRSSVGVQEQVGSLRSGVGAQGKGVDKDLECQDQQCAEEECDPDECGDEKKPPRDDNNVCGIDRRPLLPLLLVLSTLMGFVCMLMLQIPLYQVMMGGSFGLLVVIWVLYPVTLGTMAYTALCDPGQLQRENQRQSSDLEESDTGTDEEVTLPKRAHKSWLYRLPIRRYDHYCRWLTNCIGLLNHREFVVMLVCLVILGVLGSVLDVALVLYISHEVANAWSDDVFLILHFAYSVGLTVLAYPILRLHIGFISRNELAHEWKLNVYYVAHSTRTNQTVPVNDLSDDEFNERFDSFQYEANRNPFDKGIVKNCWSFWCVPRWSREQQGDF